MVDWKLYIDSPQKRALELCSGSMDEGNGWGYVGVDVVKGDGTGYGDGYGNFYGGGRGAGCSDRSNDGIGHGWFNGDGGGATKW